MPISISFIVSQILSANLSGGTALRRLMEEKLSPFMPQRFSSLEENDQQDVFKAVCSCAIFQLILKYGSQVAAAEALGFSANRASRIRSHARADYDAAISSFFIDSCEESISVSDLLDSETDSGIVDESEDRKCITFTSNQIVTLKEVLGRFEVDEEEWCVDKHVINKWPMGFTRTDDSGNKVPATIDLFQIKVWLERKMTWQSLTPIRMEALPAVTGVRADKKLKVALLLPDPQVGFYGFDQVTTTHDRAAMSIALQIASDLKPDVVVAMGDWLDLAEFSDRFPRPPEHMQKTNLALAEGAWWLNQYGSFARERVFMDGNHEKRIEKKMIKEAPEAWTLRIQGRKDMPRILSMQNLLGLDSLGYETVEAYPNGEYWLNDKVRIKHGENARSQPGATAQAVLKNSVVTQIFGHIHRVELVSKVIRERNSFYNVYGFSPGALCKIDGSVPGAVSVPDWQQGFGIVTYDPDSTYHNITPIIIENGKASFRGKLYTAVDLVSQISDDIGYSPQELGS